MIFQPYSTVAPLPVPQGGDNTPSLTVNLLTTVC